VLVYDVDRYDRYGRTLAYVYRARDALFVNGALVRDGYAVVLTVPPNVAHADEFVAWEREARRRDAGLWGACK
jgi:micrococcal nuclease